MADFVQVNARTLFEEPFGRPVLGENMNQEILQRDDLGEVAERQRVPRGGQRCERFDRFGVAPAGVLRRREHEPCVLFHFPVAGPLHGGERFGEGLRARGVVPLFEMEQSQRVIERAELPGHGAVPGRTLGPERGLRVEPHRLFGPSGMLQGLRLECHRRDPGGRGAVPCEVLRCRADQRIVRDPTVQPVVGLGREEIPRGPVGAPETGGVHRPQDAQRAVRSFVHDPSGLREAAVALPGAARREQRRKKYGENRRFHADAKIRNIFRINSYFCAVD